MITKLYAPSYYASFRCIADRCRHSCCIGWEIPIDEDTLAKYGEEDNGYKGKIKDSIKYSDTNSFKLEKNGRCPHLNDKGLCQIIIECGEDYLCDICRNHPRFYNETSRGTEIGIGISCEEACRIVLSSVYTDFICIGEKDGEREPLDFDALKERERLYSILSDQSIAYSERIKRIEEEWELSLDIHTDGEWRDLLSGLEYLDEDNRELYSAVFTQAIDRPREYLSELERFLAYLIYRHTSSAKSKYDLQISLGFSLFLERLLACLIKNGSDIFELARILSSEIEYSEDNTDIIKNEFL